jgi:RNA polymerase primary sigma factor
MVFETEPSVLPESKMPQFLLEAKDTKEVVLNEVNKLAPRVATVLKKRFGLGGEEPQDLGTVGRDLGITMEIVRQIQSKGINQLKYNRSKRDVFKDLI